MGERLECTFADFTEIPKTLNSNSVSRRRLLTFCDKTYGSLFISGLFRKAFSELSYNNTRKAHHNFHESSPDFRPYTKLFAFQSIKMNEYSFNEATDDTVFYKHGRHLPYYYNNYGLFHKSQKKKMEFIKFITVLF